jgi:uncharacterized protein DUF6496
LAHSPHGAWAFFFFGARMPLKTVKQAMHEFKEGDLHSGKGGPKVTSRKQAIAIGLSAQRRATGKRSMSKGR